MRVTVRVSGSEAIVVGAGESLAFGRSPIDLLPIGDPAALAVTALVLHRAGTNVSRLLGELIVGNEAVRLHWRGQPSAQLSSLFDAPGGARRVALTEGTTAMLDMGENQLSVLRGRQTAEGHVDLTIQIDVDLAGKSVPRPYLPTSPAEAPWHKVPTATMPELKIYTDVWFVAMALAEPWLSGDDDYPRPPTNREISEKILAWRGEAGRLAAPQRVHEAIQQIAVLAFGSEAHPFRPQEGRRLENARYAVGRRAAEVGLVTAEQLAQVERQARERRHQRTQETKKSRTFGPTIIPSDDEK
jgi:hypothetical protein